MLALGGTLLTLAPLPHAQALPMDYVLLKLETIDKLTAFFKATAADPAVKTELAYLKSQEMMQVVFDCAGFDNEAFASKYNEAFASKCPKATAALKSAGLAPNEFFSAILSLGYASKDAKANTPVESDTPQDKIHRANIEFVKANQARIDALYALDK